MAKPFFDVQAALLYDQKPSVMFDIYFDCFSAWAKDKAIPGTFRLLKGATTDTTLAIAGAGVHAFVSVSDEPCDTEEFAIPLKAPILAHKSFDYRSAIGAHRASVVITVGDGETPIPADARETFAMAGVMRASDPLLKLAVLHVLMQSLISLCKPTMASFCPSRSLLSPQELEAVAEMPLPYPILFHPLPVSNGKDAHGHPSRGMIAVNAPHLVGFDLELENVPSSASVERQIDLLAKLISNKRREKLALGDGDFVRPDKMTALQIRHEKGATADAPRRVIARFVEADARPAEPGETTGQKAFQDRIAKLKTRTASANAAFETPAAPQMAGESEEDLRTRVRDTMDPTGGVSPRTGLMNGPVKLVVATALLLAFVFFGPSQQISDMVTKDTAIVEGVKTLLVSPELATSTTATSETSGMVRTIGQSAREVLRP